jgi:hypothetical protein
VRAVQKTPEELGFSPPFEEHNGACRVRNWPFRVRVFSQLPVRLFDAAPVNCLQRAALPDSLKTDKTDDSPIHRFQFMYCFPNRVRPHDQ